MGMSVCGRSPSFMALDGAEHAGGATARAMCAELRASLVATSARVDRDADLLIHVLASPRAASPAPARVRSGAFRRVPSSFARGGAAAAAARVAAALEAASEPMQTDSSGAPPAPAAEQAAPPALQHTTQQQGQGETQGQAGAPGGLDADAPYMVSPASSRAASPTPAASEAASSLPDLRAGSSLRWTKSRKDLEQRLEEAEATARRSSGGGGGCSGAPAAGGGWEDDGDVRLAARLVELGLVLVEAKGDGNCLFRCRGCSSPPETLICS